MDDEGGYTSDTFESFEGDGMDYSVYFQTEQTWEDLEDAVAWAKEVAISHGFTLNRSSYKNGPKTASVVQLELRCSRGERYRGDFNLNEEDGGRQSSTKTCECPFMIKVKRAGRGMPFHILTRPGEHGKHNHQMFKYAEGFSHAVKITKPVDDLISRMTDAGSKPGFIMNAIRQQFPNVKLNINQIYNRRAKKRRAEMGGRGPLQFALDAAREKKYQTWVANDSETGEVSHVFFAHQTSINLLRTYPYVLLIDTTYKTNTHAWPVCEIVGVTPTNHNLSLFLSPVFN